MQYQPVKIDASHFYHRAYLPKLKPFVFSPTRQGVIAVCKWLSELMPDVRPVFRVDLSQPWGVGAFALFGFSGQAVEID